MSWQKLILEVTADDEEQISDFLSEAGAVSVNLEAADEQEVFEPIPGTTPLWDQIRLSALFPAEQNLQELLNILATQISGNKIKSINVEQVPEQDWQQNCKDQFQPMLFAERLWVYPSWCEIPDPNKPHLLLDPGLAFGTGTHPTTALCLDWLAKNIQPEQVIIDYGCGSGILALAAIKLGAKEVWAVDNDPQALEATEENAKRNTINSYQLFTVLPNELPAVQVDTVIANILANPLIELAPTLSKLVKTDGNIVLSGILKNQIDSVMSVYEHYFHELFFDTQEDWVRVVGIKK